MERSTSDISHWIKSEARRLGFTSCGIARAGFLEEEADHLDTWLKKGYHGEMRYMENHFDKRLDPRKLVHGARSVISLLYNYYPEETQIQNTYKIAKYAYGEDYHQVIRSRLRELVGCMQERLGSFHARVFTDSAPVMERTWAKMAGLGWIGKHSLLISKQKGSYFFLAEIITDLELEPDIPFASDHCGSCTRCIDACPTEAILPNNTIDGGRCISYLTIELKEQIPLSFKDKMEDWMFGCDICQDVCPWNRFSKPHSEPLFRPHPDLLNFTKKDWEEISEETYGEIFKGSAVKRAKYEGLRRTIEFLKK